MQSFGIIADDLTGALDVGGAFAAMGHRVVVDLGRGTPMTNAAADVIIVDTGLRDLDHSEVKRGISGALARLRAAGAELRMLKIDSTLRGPVTEMLAAALAMGDCRDALVAPAFPEQGRVVVNGRLRVHGLDVGVDLRGILASLSVDLHSVTSRSLADKLGECREVDTDRRIFLAQAETVNDMNQIANSWLGSRYPTLLVGSAGVGRRVAAAQRRDGLARPSPNPTSQAEVSDKWYLVAAGSPTDTTSSQIDVLNGALLHDSMPTVKVLRSPPSSERDAGEAASALAGEVSKIAAEAITAQDRPAGMVLVGGDTSGRILAALGATAIEVRGEVEAGVPFGVVIGGVWEGLVIVTKAGSFGGESTLVNAVNFLRESSCALELGKARAGIEGAEH